jgi:predicted nucleotidyltransferase
MDPAAVQRGLDHLVGTKLVRAEPGGRYRPDTQQTLVASLWGLFMVERRMGLQASVRNAVEAFFAAVSDEVEVFILFGSAARGLAQPGSDLDVLVVGNLNQERALDFFPLRFEIHNVGRAAIENADTLVLLDALLNGVVFKGGDIVFRRVASLESFSKHYLASRLSNAKEFQDIASRLIGEARSHYDDMADATLAEVESVLLAGTTISKREMKAKHHDILALEDLLARQGERVWLTPTSTGRRVSSPRHGYSTTKGRSAASVASPTTRSSARSTRST